MFPQFHPVIGALSALNTFNSPRLTENQFIYTFVFQPKLLAGTYFFVPSAVPATASSPQFSGSAWSGSADRWGDGDGRFSILHIYCTKA